MFSEIVFVSICMLLGLICYYLWVRHLRRKWGNISRWVFLFPFILLSNTPSDKLRACISFFVIYIYSYIILSIATMILGCYPTSYTILCAFFMAFELVIFYLVGLVFIKKKFIPTLLLIIFVAVIFYGGYANIANRSYQPLNIVDFFISLVKILIIILAFSLIVKKKVVSGVEIIYILMGFLIFFLLQLFNTILVIQDLDANWRFMLIAPIFAFAFWGSSLIWIHKIQSRFYG